MAPHDLPHDPAGIPDGPGTTGFDIDLAAHELLRRAQILDALGPDWDPVEVMRGEEEAYDLLYSGLDAEQQRVYEDLVAAGVLPRRGGGGRASA
ncbi:DUF6400 family protein [Streptomyces sp. NPDC007369]|uniref:DUF6400 family protein n=1 Tax=Streptomyces sp. NPDC007369 TaxID=3154589 RepID=UPI0033C4F295